MRTLSHDQARRVYDRIGSKQDTQAFYEDRATRELVAHGDFANARSVFEFGCGTGRFAEGLLENHLAADATYHAVDLSPKMVSIAEARLVRFGDRVTVQLTEGEPPSARADASYDRFVSNYVLDLLSEEAIETLLEQAHRILRPAGLFCLASLSVGATPASRLVARLWSGIHALHPALVGGCRPIQLLALLPEARWSVVHHVEVAPFAIPSEVVVAARR
jgi:ubiquinone/menaquinone biosynthesis C-methylase UbiE